MSEKNLDGHGRWRNVTIAFRVSPEENAEINRRVKLSGLTKQEYISLRCQEKAVVVAKNPRVYKALKGQLEEIHHELQRISDASECTDEFLELVQMVADVLGAMKE